MTNVQYKIEDYRDIETQNFYQERLEKGYAKEEIMRSIYAKSRDNARTPMQWINQKNAGFTDGEPWIPINPNYQEIYAENQVMDPDSIFGCYKRLIQLRKEYPVLVDGAFQMFWEEDPNIFAYSRKNEEAEIAVIGNFFEQTVSCRIEELGNSWELILCNYKKGIQPSVLRPYETRMYWRKRNL